MRHLALTIPLLLLAQACTGHSPTSKGEETPLANEVVAMDEPLSEDAERAVEAPAGTTVSSEAESMDSTTPDPMAEKANDDMTHETSMATLGAGCFWCVEAVLEQLDGIEDVTSGYMGGGERKPTYKEVCTGTTDYVEVVQVHFDERVLSYDDLLSWFWRLHDPTTLNRQGNDVGPQYRSVIFTHSEEQREQAEASRKAADASGAFVRPIVTAIEEADVYHVAEEYHQDYYRANKAQGYCRMVIAPKLDKLDLDK